MHRLVVSYPTPADPDRFLDYYAGRHLPLARALPGLIASRWMRPAPLGPGEAVPFVVFEADFADEETMLAALRSPIGAQVAADVPNYSPAGARLTHYAVPDA